MTREVRDPPPQKKGKQKVSSGPEKEDGKNTTKHHKTLQNKQQESEDPEKKGRNNHKDGLKEGEETWESRNLPLSLCAPLVTKNKGAPPGSELTALV